MATITFVGIHSLIFMMVVVFGQATGTDPASPNIVLILCDDNDLTLGGMDPLTKTRKLLTEEGVSLTNFFANTPICCPSRTALLSGRYSHNTGQAQQGWCGDTAEQTWREKTFPAIMQKNGYETALFGKYMNNYGSYCHPNNRLSLVGWDRYFALCNDNQYFNNEFNDQGNLVKFGDHPQDYMTSVIGNKTLSWLKSWTRKKRKIESNNDSKLNTGLQNLENDGNKSHMGEAEAPGKAEVDPFFLYLAPHAPHVPATPAPWYSGVFANKTAPRTPNYDYTDETHHWLIRQQPKLGKDNRDMTDSLFGKRWETLLSVDDLVSDVFHYLKSVGEVENTYFILTSDHGYQLGQFRLPSCKIQVYDDNIRIPAIIRGPGIQKNSVESFVSGIVDIAPTILDLAGVNAPDYIDGNSFKDLIVGDEYRKKKQKTWSPFHVVEKQYKTGGLVIRGAPNPVVQAKLPPLGDGRIIDSPNNTYIAIRYINDTHNYLYSEFTTQDDRFHFSSPNEFEAYDLKTDPFQMKNIYQQMDKSLLEELKNLLHQQYICSGAECK